ncbi:MAG: antitoxin VapB family protein [Candidatus Sigynarchaeota archaeon]
MTSRNISIRDDLYKRLTRLKRPDQSYSDFIEALLDEGVKGSFSRLMKYFGIMSDLPEEIEKIIEEKRKKANESLHARTINQISRLHEDDTLP